jgi:hypothetical protein
MEPEYIYTKKESADLREKIINYTIVPQIQLVFSRYPQIRSAILLIAQYWNDEASDEVHYQIIFSVLPTPKWEIGLTKYHEYDPINLPELPRSNDIYERFSEDFDRFKNGEYCWENDGDTIPAFAAYCKEGCHQDMEYLEAYNPYAVFRRKEEEIEIEVVGNMLRPWLDGIRSTEHEY